MNIVFRTDSSIHIGLGHVMRCIVLAHELKSQGHNVQFATRPQNGDSIDLIRGRGFIVHELPQPKEWLLPKTTSDYAAWLQVPVQLDAKHFISSVNFVDMVIVDHYALNAEWQTEVRHKLGCKIVVIDDLVREHNADLIVDQTLMRMPEEYKSTNEVLTGCDYALLNPKFSSKRESALENNVLPKRRKVLLSIGGIDKDNATLKILKVLQTQLNEKVDLTVLLGNKSPHYKSVKAFCGLNANWIEHIDFVDDMAGLMLNHSLSIGAPGTTSWERACLGLPSIIIPLAANQQTIAKNLDIVNASIVVEIEELSHKLISSYYKLLDNWSKYRRNNLKLCDGLGVRRVTQSISNLQIEDTNELNLVRATEDDIRQVYTWQCHPETRRFALNSEIPTWEVHNLWMIQKLESVQDFFYMIKISGYNRSVGVVRLDRIKKAEYTVSIFISPEHFGQGIAKRALSFIDNIHKDVTLHATVLEDNTASQKLFTICNYKRVTKDTFIRLPII